MTFPWFIPGRTHLSGWQKHLSTLVAPGRRSYSLAQVHARHDLTTKLTFVSPRGSWAMPVMPGPNCSRGEDLSAGGHGSCPVHDRRDYYPSWGDSLILSST